jgi:hypothetical protein
MGAVCSFETFLSLSKSMQHHNPTDQHCYNLHILPCLVIVCPFVLCSPSTKLKLTIISGQHIPKANQEMEGEVVDPYVVVKIVGHPADAQKCKTDMVRNNGESCVVSTVVSFYTAKLFAM